MFYAACLCSFVLFHAYYDISYCIYALKSVIKLCMTHVETAQKFEQSVNTYIFTSVKEVKSSLALINLFAKLWKSYSTDVHKSHLKGGIRDTDNTIIGGSPDPFTLGLGLRLDGAPAYVLLIRRLFKITSLQQAALMEVCALMNAIVYYYVAEV